MCYLFHLFPLLLPEKMEVGSSWLGPQDGFLPGFPVMEGTTVTTKSSTKSPKKRRAPVRGFWGIRELIFVGFFF